MPTKAAIKDIQNGMQEVKSRLRPAADGKPRLFFMRDSLVSRDPLLAERAKPLRSVEEFGGYILGKTDSSKLGELPAPNQDDHGMDCIRYMCRWLADKPRNSGVSQISFPEKANILDDMPPDIWHSV